MSSGIGERLRMSDMMQPVSSNIVELDRKEAFTTRGCRVERTTNTY